ncbi:hypothetical protein [uncultured Bacteroides sp.]|uniref:hypothetical protein n=1 Tax=uncultured Bacteroides sp. TaxID=162156 RepID=UPI002615B8C2|nr:hypothetical protein [uncultured Bacteroides sp.]
MVLFLDGLDTDCMANVGLALLTRVDKRILEVDKRVLSVESTVYRVSRQFEPDIPSHAAF